MMMLKIKFTAQMKRDLKLQVKRGKNPVLLEKILEKLANRIPLEKKHHDHALSGDWAGYHECHIENDWCLFIWSAKKNLFCLPPEPVLMRILAGNS
jgi:mRNA interferase YafQ